MALAKIVCFLAKANFIFIPFLQLKLEAIQSITVTLEGFPLRIENTNQYLVYNNPSTDKAWKIQILKIEDGNVNLQDEITFPDEIHLKKVLRLEQNEIFILDDTNQIWKTVVKK